MSWEYNEYTKPCACGRGLIKVVDGSNDWRQTSNEETILCPECREKDEINKELRQKRLSIAKNKISLVVSYFRENYMDQLNSKFMNSSSKKAIWQTAFNLGIDNQCLTTFYKHYISKDYYISHLVNWDRIKSIVKALKIDDETFDKLYQDAANHIKEFDDERAAASYFLYKGR